MTTSSIPISSELNENKITSNIISSNHHRDSDHFLSNVLRIEEDTITLEKQTPGSSLLIAIHHFICRVKARFSRHVSPQPLADIELNNILSQGKALSHDSDIVHSLLNNKAVLISPSPSLTTKTRVVLGGVLLTSTLVGSGLYYLQRTGRNPHHDMPANKTHSGLQSLLPLPDSHYYTVTSYSFANLDIESTEIRNKILDDKKRINSITKKTAAYFPPLGKQYYKKPSNNARTCPPMDGKKKTKFLKCIYVYTPNQAAVCLTESFNLRCQKAHRQARAKKGCMNIPRTMILKITGKNCLCPPPDWLELKVVRRLSPKKRVPIIRPRPIITSTSTQRLPSNVNRPLTDRYSENDEILKNRLSDSYGYIIPTEKNTHILPGQIHPESSTTESSQGVSRISLVECANERNNLTLSKNLRIISETINNPISTLLREGKVVIQYDYTSQRCTNDTQFYEMSKKVESSIESLLSWIPGYNRLRFITRVISSLLETYSDALDGNDLNMNNIEDLNTRLIGLSKDVISAISTKDINRIIKNPDIKETEKIIKSLTYQKDNLMIIIGPDGKKVKVQKKFNHFSDPERNGYIFYDDDKKWFIYDDLKLDNHIKDTLRKSSAVWPDIENIYFFRNSSPSFYGDGIILRYHGELYSFIKNELYKVTEAEITDTVYRYLVEDNHKQRPIIFKGEEWVFEEQTSPFASKNLYELLSDSYNIYNKLVSDTISHQNVSPLTPGRDIQFDSSFNHYIKINDQYFRIKTSLDTSYYMEGTQDLLALQGTGNTLNIKSSLLDDTCCFHKEPLNKIPSMLPDDNFFLDNTVINHIKSISIAQSKTGIKNIISNHMKVSPDIKGAVTDEGVNYLYYQNNLIKIHSNNDDTYILGDREESEENILIYKNMASDTYFKLPVNRKKWQGLIEKSSRCIVKKQPMSACSVSYFETDRIRHLLDENSNQGIIIEDHHNQLEPYNGFYAIYQKKNNIEELYYKGKGDLFFHVRKNKNNLSSFTPSVFIIYGKDSKQQINLDYVISSISIIKDFDTKKIIFSTPVEAAENVFDINKKLLEMFIKWQGSDKVYKNITPQDLSEIETRLPLLNELSDLNELFNRSGKKVITSLEHSESILKKEMGRIFEPNPEKFLEIINLQQIKNTKINPVIEDICNHAFKKTLGHINDALTTIEISKEKLNDYIVNVLGISDSRAGDIFMVSLKSKLERMKMIFNKDSKENIIIITKKKSEEINRIIFTDKEEITLGFTILNDPLDRIFINTAMINDFPKETQGQDGTGKEDNIQYPQPPTPRRNRIFFINLIADTMLHEAVHILGSPEDYLYLSIDSEGKINNIDKSIKQIEDSIAHRKMNTLKFEYLSKLYFMSNPLYQDFTIDSLNRPEALKEIFRTDSFFRAIVLLNNPDTISLLIRELAAANHQDESESPKLTGKEPASLPTKK